MKSIPLLVLAIFCYLLPIAQTSSVLTRGPYLQMGNQTAVTLRWRTDVATDSKFEAGTTFGNYSISASNNTATTEHEVRLTGLTAATKYYYRFGSSTQVLQSGSDNFFHTAPDATSTAKTRIAVFGDCGRNENNFQTGSLNSYLQFVNGNPSELLLIVGDNAYNNGLDAEYQTNFFNVYSPNILKNHVLFPAPGNHEYGKTSQKLRDIAYYKIFTMPTAAECGGVASGTESFYSYNWGNIHFISLDSYGEEADNTRLYDTLGPQVTWVKKDLAANKQKWTIAYWHHPPFSMGSNNSDTIPELINIRQNFIRIMERHGVDLIICGHSHDYERSYLLNNYYGTEASFNPGTHAVSTSSGKYDGTANSCPYITTGSGNKGVVYVVSGSSGADGIVQPGYPHNAMPFSIDDGGMFYLEVEDKRLDAKFIRKDGVIADKFTIMHDVNKTTNSVIAAGNSITLTASWKGTYSWSNGATTQSISVAPTTNTTYSVSDGKNCLTDVFNITASTVNALPDPAFGTELFFAPNIVKRGQSIELKSSSNLKQQAYISDNNGHTINTIEFSGNTFIETQKLAAGMYFLSVKGKKKTHTQKFIVID